MLKVLDVVPIYSHISIRTKQIFFFDEVIYDKLVLIFMLKNTKIVALLSVL